MDTPIGEIDPHRPWIRDVRDDPGAMNWAETLLNPLGETSKLHFSRAWTFMFLGRIALYLVPSLVVAVLGISGLAPEIFSAPVNFVIVTVPAVLVPFALFTVLTEFTSFVAHTRRLADAARPTWLAVIVLIPFTLGLIAYGAGTQMGAAQHRQMNAPPAEKTEEAPKAGEKAAEAKPGEKPKSKQRRGPPGPPGPPQSERQMAVSTGLGLALPVWALASLGVMIWTLAFVARLPNGGQGPLRTGSDLTPEELAGGY
jgi:uncharacterized membrane protein YhaH (DUF805 family)